MEEINKNRENNILSYISLNSVETSDDNKSQYFFKNKYPLPESNFFNDINEQLNEIDINDLQRIPLPYIYKNIKNNIFNYYFTTYLFFQKNKNKNSEKKYISKNFVPKNMSANNQKKIYEKDKILNCINKNKNIDEETKKGEKRNENNGNNKININITVNKNYSYNNCVNCINCNDNHNNNFMQNKEEKTFATKCDEKLNNIKIKDFFGNNNNNFSNIHNNQISIIGYNNINALMNKSNFGNDCNINYNNYTNFNDYSNLINLPYLKNMNYTMNMGQQIIINQSPQIEMQLQQVFPTKIKIPTNSQNIINNNENFIPNNYINLNNQNINEQNTNNNIIPLINELNEINKNQNIHSLQNYINNQNLQQINSIFNQINPMINHSNEIPSIQQYKQQHRQNSESLKESEQQESQETENSNENGSSTSIPSNEYLIQMFGRTGWVCRICNNFNYETRSKCNRCETLKAPRKVIEIKKRKEKELKEMVRGGNTRISKKGDWLCNECQNLNYGFRKVCNKCKADKPNITNDNKYFAPFGVINQLNNNNSNMCLPLFTFTKNKSYEFKKDNDNSNNNSTGINIISNNIHLSQNNSIINNEKKI